jgi:hypothetical protein
MRHVETVPGIGGEKEIKENGGGGEFNYDTFDIFYEFCKCHSVPPVQQE